MSGKWISDSQGRGPRVQALSYPDPWDSGLALLLWTSISSSVSDVRPSSPQGWNPLSTPLSLSVSPRRTSPFQTMAMWALGKRCLCPVTRELALSSVPQSKQ